MGKIKTYYSWNFDFRQSWVKIFQLCLIVNRQNSASYLHVVMYCHYLLKHQVTITQNTCQCFILRRCFYFQGTFKALELSDSELQFHLEHDFHKIVLKKLEQKSLKNSIMARDLFLGPSEVGLKLISCFLGKMRAL